MRDRKPLFRFALSHNETPQPSQRDSPRAIPASLRFPVSTSGTNRVPIAPSLILAAWGQPSARLPASKEKPSGAPDRPEGFQV